MYATTWSRTPRHTAHGLTRVRIELVQSGWSTRDHSMEECRNSLVDKFNHSRSMLIMLSSDESQLGLVIRKAVSRFGSNTTLQRMITQSD